MPERPKGGKRPSDVIGATIMATKIATGGITGRTPQRMMGRWHLKMNCTLLPGDWGSVPVFGLLQIDLADLLFV